MKPLRKKYTYKKLVNGRGRFGITELELIKINGKSEIIDKCEWKDWKKQNIDFKETPFIKSIKNRTMKPALFFFFSLLIISCSTKEKKGKINTQTKVISEIIITENKKVSNLEVAFEEIQDSLRILILNSKPNTNLKSNSVLQELYIRGLVNQIDDKIKFELPFNLHGFDCGTPDCYSTDITFDIRAKDPIEFPKTINVKLLEHGCGIESALSENGIFKLIEESPKSVNYYSKKHNSNLVILGEKRELYYFPNTKENSIKINLIDKIVDSYNEDNENSIVPYQSTIMKTNEYKSFIKE